MSLQYGYALAAILLLTALNFFFSLVEAALVTVRYARLQQMVQEGPDAGAAGDMKDLLRQPARVMATVQVGLTLASFAVAAIAASVLSPPAAHWLALRGVAHPLRTATVLLTLAAALLTIIVGELVPRAIARRRPERTAVLVVKPLRVSIFLLSWLGGITLGLSNLLVRPFGLTASFAAPVMTEEELRTLLEASAQSGAIEEDEKEIIRNVISFGDTDVRQVMTPRIDVKALEVSQGLPALLDLIVESGHSRIPVYEGTVDAIVGIVHAKDLLPALARGEREIDPRAIMRAPLLVPENKRVDGLLDEFRRSNIQMAIVQDEYGGTAGLATIEDLLEELVGEIKDEYDTEEPLLQVISPETSLVDGRMGIDDLNEQMGLDLPHADFDTIGGYVFGLFGRQPGEGEAIRQDGVEFVVEKTDGRRVQQVRLTKHPSGVADGNGTVPTENPG